MSGGDYSWNAPPLHIACMLPALHTGGVSPVEEAHFVSRRERGVKAKEVL